MKLLIDDYRTEDMLQYGKIDRIARTYDEGIEALKSQHWDLLILDHDLGDTNPNKTGYGIMLWLEQNRQHLPRRISFCTLNSVGKDNMMAVRHRIYTNVL